MDKLEHYLDRVCLSIGGPKSLRKHVRQELREHLLDAVADRKAAGMSEEEALARALEDFGGPEQVRSELEATHGHRLLPIVIDRAMHWKEMTMKAKWLWTTWVYLAVVGIIALEFLYICFNLIYVVPKLMKLQDDGFLDEARRNSAVETVISYLYSFMHGAEWTVKNLLWLAPTAIAAWGLFEWRVRSENKTFMRLSVLGTIALTLMLAVVFFTTSLILLMFVAAGGAIDSAGDHMVLDLTAQINTSVAALHEAAKTRDLERSEEHAQRASQSFETLIRLEKKVRLRWWGTTKDQLVSAQERFAKVSQAVRKNDAEELRKALDAFEEAYEPVRKWAAKLAQIRE